MGRHQRLHRWLSGLLVGVRCHPPPGYTREIPADRRRPPSTEFPDCDPQARGFYRPLRGFQLRPHSPQAGSLLLFAAQRQPEGYVIDAKSSTGVALGVGCRCKKQQAWRFDGRACTFLVRARSLRASELPVRAAKSGLSAAPPQPGRARWGLRASGAGPRGGETQASGAGVSPDLVPPPPKRLAAAARRASRATPLPPALAKR